MGDQRFEAPNSENGRVRDHAANGDRIRLLRYVGKNSVQYSGELVLDPDDPWRWVDSYDARQHARRMIQFRFLPVGAVLRTAQDPIHEEAGASANQVGVTPIPADVALTEIEALNSRQFKVLLAAREQLYDRAESTLVHDFCAWLLAARGLEATGLSIPYVVESRRLRADIYIPGRNLLIEAKPTTAREHIRLAIGQLFDYRRWLAPSPSLAILTNQEPADDMKTLLDDLQINQIWRERKNVFGCSPVELLDAS